MNNTTVRYGLAAAAIVLVALLGMRFLPGADNIGGSTPTPTPSAQPTPTVEPTPEFPALGTQASLAPARHAVPGFEAGVTVAIPSGGWSSNDNWVVIGPRGNEEPDGMAIRFYTAQFLYANPASRADGFVEVGPSGDDLVQAILEHPILQAAGPTDITIDGRAGQMVEFAIPADADMTSAGEYLLFSDATAGDIWGWAAGQTFNLYIVDVDGERLIIDAFHFADTPGDDLAAQRAVIDSIQFDTRP